ncbi:tail protein X [Billgrantia ethanolica]|uniref:Phage tail protein n=1 Tax=Billgrantia ethanolica TaxID=2733486 RepID=A0ABS9A176_9GAMM|nr:tail protein X [Halomonas ethanolica]MCE8002525.1 phage tail protein [Halomonas ethanolica]
MQTVRAHQGETLDALCHRVLGTTAAVTEQVLQLNPGLAELGPILPEGTPVKLPDAPPQPERRDVIQLWT